MAPETRLTKYRIKIQQRLSDILDFFKKVVSDFIEDNGLVVAAAVSFYSFLSLFPLLILAVAIIGFILGSPHRAIDVVSAYSQSFAVGAGAKVIEDVVQGRSVASVLGALLLLWTGTGAIVILEHAVNVAWDIDRKRNFFKQRMVAVFILGLMGAFLGISIGTTALFRTLRSLHTSLLGISTANLGWLWDILGYLVPLIFTIISFTLIYLILPNTRVKLKVAFVGGVFAGILWELAKIGYSFYVANIVDYNKVYGSLGGVILLLIWIDYSSVITLIGAEVASIWGRRHGLAERNR